MSVFILANEKSEKKKLGLRFNISIVFQVISLNINVLFTIV